MLFHEIPMEKFSCSRKPGSSCRGVAPPRRCSRSYWHWGLGCARSSSVRSSDWWRIHPGNLQCPGTAMGWIPFNMGIHGIFLGPKKWGLASGKHTKSYWKWTIYSWFAHQKWWFSIVLLIYQRVFLMGPWEWAIEEFIYIMSYKLMRIFNQAKCCDCSGG